MSYWYWAIIGTLIAMVWTMLKYHIEPLIILALLVCVSLLAMAVMFVVESNNDELAEKVKILERQNAEYDRKFGKCDERLKDLERM